VYLIGACSSTGTMSTASTSAPTLPPTTTTRRALVPSTATRTTAPRRDTTPTTQSVQLPYHIEVGPGPQHGYICVRGYTATVRPPEEVTGPEKRASAAAYGYTGSLHTAEYDHLIPLELGGDPNDPANLWVQPNDRARATTTFNSKDTLENTLHDLVCSAQMPLATARQMIATNWAVAYQRYG
jgi:hypothetical protein